MAELSPLSYEYFVHYIQIQEKMYNDLIVLNARCGQSTEYHKGLLEGLKRAKMALCDGDTLDYVSLSGK